ncbi:RlmI/RlmK family 23S rRNA methyltransferase [Bacillus pseudomycoides]|uniref:class I SAM-dependent rRNA methyltransferase n=1 Tax=Bacillus pseudomycoides TaxID=64104 RepID=UPI000BEE6F26|nr:class I SAM-dependent rRNA methyltransferase [Bacillus pseudomycoides]PDY45716.1 RlmI/RlmK family 23S rRNA methyltransferase [Bacillus pseudomycoides]PEA82841.1 RlmI/RlmK family 23S rRNA methyltransferase [Bacillus pseudomycoides]PED73374.1 RlmI/RlmK family 23S rRNA methyltransferase [Bacillus pseudomycoides]PEI37028.1 RlmI/RlmK family 23S rRNA methyltransferase [Bacillus pseudomycoides]PEJ73673.1 RlmI/RlmK family 23S rRNA methyltransferase [Bacillus pseudomycoides]
MRSEVTVKIKPKFIKEIKSGYPLILKDAIQNLNDIREEGQIIKIVDEKNQFLGKGYYGKQNKGYGWVLTRKEQEHIDQAFFERKIKSALHKRKGFYKANDTTAFRVVNGEGDGLGGLIIDYYEGFYVISWYSEGIYSFKNEIIEALQKVANFKGIYQKKRFDTKGKYIEDDDFVVGERSEFPIIVKENGVNFAVYLNDGAMVGVFLDQRNVRKQIRDTYAKGKTVLNMFSYTGAFSVFAALGGATKTTSVDLANRSLSKTIEQFSVNGIDYEAQDIIVEDVFHYFKYAAKKQMKFDMVVLDPPSFARSKKYTFSAAKDYKNLLKETIAITENNGIIVASTNCSTFDMKKFKGFIDTAFKEMNGKYKILEEHSLPEDFRTIDQFKEGDYLKVVFIEKIKG